MCSLSRYWRCRRCAGYRPKARYVFCVRTLDASLNRYTPTTLNQIHSPKVRFMDRQKSQSKPAIPLLPQTTRPRWGYNCVSLLLDSLRSVSMHTPWFSSEIFFNCHIIPDLAKSVQPSIFNNTRTLKLIMHMTILTPKSLCRLARGWNSICNTCARGRLRA